VYVRTLGTSIAKIGSSSKANWGWLFRLTLALLSCVAIGNSQSSMPTEIGNVSDGISTKDSTLPTKNISSEKPEHASPAAGEPGSIVGTVLDQSGAVSVGTVVRFTSEGNPLSLEVVSGNNGQYSFSKVPPGRFKLSVNSTGFGEQAFSGELASGQTYLMPTIVLSIATVITDVTVRVDPVEVATEEVKEQEHQRVLGFIPNFYVTYRDDPAPLTKKLKFQLAWKSSTDPVTILGGAFLAGVQQAGDQYSELGQGAKGYGKRFGAVYADIFASTFLSGAIFPSLLKQDPRYFYKEGGTTHSRIWRAVSNSVLCKGDNGRWQINYSNIAGSFGGAAISSSIYPSKSQASVIVSNGLVRMGESSLAGIFQQFVARKLMRTSRRQAGMHPGATEVSSTQGNSLPVPKMP
jgi:Carboxypeptidase regulatory-like domain